MFNATKPTVWVHRAGVASTAAALLAGLVAAPAAANHDLYRRLSAGAGNRGNGAFAASFQGVSADGKRVFFSSQERLVLADGDSSADIYERSGGTTKRVSSGAVNGNGAFDATLVGISTDGSRAFFITREQLVSADTDSVNDIYERSAGGTTLVSAGAINGNGPNPASFRGKSSDGTRVFFITSEQLVAGDTDASFDVYERSGGTTTLVSLGSINGNLAFDSDFAGASASGASVWFITTEKLVAPDTDSQQDIYARSGGQTFLISRGAINGNGNTPAAFKTAAADGSRVLFSTSEKLTTSDLDSSSDIYQFSPGGVITLISAGAINGNGPESANFVGATADVARVFFTTNEKLVTDDIDAVQDIYQRAGGVTTRVSFSGFNGNGAFAASFSAASADGSRVFFQTQEKLAGSDTDASDDVYEFSAGTTTKQVTVGAINGNGAFPASFGGTSADGTRVFFVTAEQLTNDDDDTTTDVYERTGGQTHLVSIGAGNVTAFFNRCSSDGLAVIFSTDEKLLASDKDAVADVYGAYDAF